MMKFYELVLIWETGEKEVYSYATEEEAQTSMREFRSIFGNQISWVGVRKKSCVNVETDK